MKTKGGRLIALLLVFTLLLNLAGFIPAIALDENIQGEIQNEAVNDFEDKVQDSEQTDNSESDNVQSQTDDSKNWNTEQLNELEELGINNAIEAQSLSTAYTLTIPHEKVGDVVDSTFFPSVVVKSGTAILDSSTMDTDDNFQFTIQFQGAGTAILSFSYTANGGTVYADERTCDVTFNVSSDGVVSVTKAEYLLDGIVTGEQDAFVTKYPMQSSVWSASTIQKAQEIMTEMSDDEKIGQLFLVHYPGDGSGSIAQATERINTWHPGGYLVFAAMFNNSTPTKVQEKTAAAQAAAIADSGIPMIFSVDEEGGKVVRISDKEAFGHARFDYPQNIAANGESAVEADAADKALFLKNLGMTVNHAPVGDVSGSTGYIYPRTYGGNGLHNGRFVAAAVRGHEQNGISTSVKHFPGYGGTSSDTHNGFAINTLSLGDFEYNDLIPFYQAMGAGGKSIMVTHNIINCWDSEMPASLSSEVINYARNEMGFDGVIMTDDLNMEAIITAVGSGNASLACIQAGVDMPMTPQPEKDIPVVKAAIADGRLSMSRIEESCLRVLCWKIEMGLIGETVDPNPSTPPVPEEQEAEWTSLDGGTVKQGKFDDMWSEVTSQGGIIKLLVDIDTIGDKSVPAKNITLNLNGHKLNFTGGTNGFIVNGTTSTSFTVTDSVNPIVTKEENPEILVDAAWNAVRRELVYYTIAANGTKTKYSIDMDSCGSIGGSNTGIMIEVKSGVFNLDGGVLTHKVRAVETINNASNVINVRGGAIMGCGVASGGSTVNGSGVGIYGGGTLNISGGYIGGNSATTRGGGIIVDAGKLNMTGGVLAVNSTNTNGGAIYMNSNTAATISGGVIACNHAGSQAGGIYLLGTNSSLTISKDAIMSMNSTGGNGGAIFSMAGWGSTGNATVNIQGGLFTGNTAQSGGALRTGSGVSNGGTINITGGEFAYNEALASGTGFGGAIHAYGTTGGVNISGAAFHHNTAKDGGAIYIDTNKSGITLSNVQISANKASSSGGGLYVGSTSGISLADVTIIGNIAGIAGGGVYNSGTSMTLQNYVRVNTNKVGDESNNLYLPSGKILTLSNVLAGDSLVRVYTETLPTETSAVDMVTAGNALWLTNSLSMFKSDRVGYTPVLPSNKIVLAVGSGSHEGTEIKFDGILFQYYSELNRLSSEGDEGRRLEVIDTTGGVLPQNGVSPTLKYLYLNADGSVKMDSVLMEIYAALDVNKDNLRPLDELNKFSGESDYYSLTELWVAPSGQYAGSTDKDDWAVYPWSSELSLTTDASKVDSKTIYVDTGSVVRYVCKPVTGSFDTSAVFYDYDISDGHIYASASAAFSQTEQIPTSSQDSRTTSNLTSFANTVRKGINDSDNYADKSLALLGFGNANMQTGLASQSVNGFSINQANRGANHFKLCSFGIVTGLDENGHLIYNPKISAPNLFDEGEAIGKTMIAGHTLGFVRDGDSCTLNSVSGTGLDGLSVFGHPGIYDGVQNKTCIWTNNFWPLDEMGTFGTDSHDFKFGNGSLANSRKIVTSTGAEASPAVSDDGQDHNAYFGMQFALKFEMEPDYVGPMEYYFFGDDDMWVFLDNQLVSDVGGVHQSAGSYVDLWDYVEKGSSGKHTLRFFFTERGASGSTCWMRFNIPHMQDITNDVVNFPGSLKIQKTVEGIETDDAFEFTVALDLQDTSGTTLADTFTYIGSKSGEISSGGTISLANGEYVIIQNLPEGTTYTVTEKDYNFYVSTSTDASGLIGDGTSIAAFTNIYKAPTGTLKISKQVLWDEPTNTDIKFPFLVTLRNPNDDELTDTYEYTGSLTGTLQSGDVVYLGDGEYIDILEIPDGTEYEVTEQLSDKWELVDSSNTTGVIQYNTSSEALFTNQKAGEHLEMPATGGHGATRLYQWGGLLLITAIGAAKVHRRKGVA